MGSSHLFENDLMALKAVRQLSGDAKHGDTFRLADLMVAGDAAGFEREARAKSSKDAQGNSVLPAAGGARTDAAVDKARLMAILASCSAAKDGMVPYATLAKALGLAMDDVEAWVVRAIGMRLLEARLDQVREAVLVKRCTHRVFDQASWKDLKARLQAVKASVSDIASMVATKRALPAAVKA